MGCIRSTVRPHCGRHCAGGGRIIRVPSQHPRSLRMRSLSNFGLCVRTASVALGLLSLGAQSAWAVDVCVYTDSAHPVAAPPTVRLIRLDEPARLQAALSNDLPRDAAGAAQAVRERLSAEGDSLNRRLSAAYQGVVEAWSLGILKLPAVVVDGRFVVYGDTDVAHALSLIEQYRGGTR
jgi:integrating conjugative element protein (TIGR03757 family)